MAVNTTLAGLSQTAASNGPDGAVDAPSTLDDAIRYHGAFIAKIRDDAIAFGLTTASGNTTATAAEKNLAAASLGILGIGQTWQILNSGTRAFSIDYTNTTGRPIAVSVTGQITGSQGLFLSVDGFAISKITGSASTTGVIYATVFAIVPTGSVYQVFGSALFNNWAELR